MKSSEMINKIKTLLDIQVKLEERKLENGTVVEADSFEKGKEIFIKTDDERVAMPVGEYILESGELVVVEEEGVIADVREVSDEAPEKEETEDMAEGDDEAVVEDWAGMEKRIKNLEDAVADLKKDKEPVAEESVEAESDEERQIKSRTVKEEFEEAKEEAKDELSVEPIKHSPEGIFQKEAKFHFANKRPTSILDSIMEKITNN